MGDIAVPTSKQHMTADCMADVVLARTVKFLFVDAGVACLPLFQSMLMNIMFAPAVLCSSGPVPRSVAATDVEANPADDITVLVK